MTVYLVRHVQDDETVRGGWSNHGLTSIGVKQVQALAKELAAENLSFDRIYSSDLKRAAENAEILSDSFECAVEYVPELREVNNGVLSGMKNELSEEMYPGLYWSTLNFDECYPNGESPEMFFNRIKSVWAVLKSKLIHEAKDALIVTHGGVIEAILCIENGITFTNKTQHFRTSYAKAIPIEV